MKTISIYLLIPTIAIIAIVVLEIIALKKGIDGTCFSIAIGLIAGIATGGAIKLKDVLKR